jgi:hypothetical protein
MSVVELLDLATFSSTDRRAPEPVPLSVPTDEDDDVWDAETADETPEDLEAILLAARDELENG